MQSAILVGGVGTRLGDLTKTTPKPMLDVAGRPFLRWLVENSIRFGNDDILLLAGHCADVIEEYLRGVELGARVRVVKEPAPLGTGGAIRFAASFLEKQFLLMNGDLWFDFNLLDLCTDNWPQAGIVRMAARRVSDISRFGAVDLALSGEVSSFGQHLKEHKPGLINGGVYRIERDGFMPYIPKTGACSLELEVFPNIAADGKLYGREYNCLFIDIGVPDQFKAAQEIFPFRRGAVFFDRDGVLNHDYGYVHRIEDFHWIDGAMETIRAVNDEGRFAFVVTNQAGVARGLYTENHVHKLHSWMNRELARIGAHIDDFAYCPYHPEGIVPQFARGCDRRKPAPGMILDLMSKWPVDPSRSVLVGDKDSDLAAADAAGIKSVYFSGGKLSELGAIFKY